MICDKCRLDFSDKDLIKVYEIPVFMDPNKRRSRLLCKNCKETYENEAIKYAFNNLSLLDKEIFINSIELFARRYFNPDGFGDGFRTK